MPTIPIGRLIDKTLIAKTNVNGYKGDFKTINYSFQAGAIIGKIYSWVTDAATGKLYFMVYVTNNDFTNFNPTYFLISDKQLKIPELPDILKQIEREKEAEDIKNIKETKGIIGYYIEKYVPTVLAVTLGIYAIKNLSNGNTSK